MLLQEQVDLPSRCDFRPGLCSQPWLTPSSAVEMISGFARTIGSLLCEPSILTMDPGPQAVSGLCLHHSPGGFVGTVGYCRSGQPSLQQCSSLPRLQTGWSVHTYQTEKQRRSQCLSPGELEVILQVIQRAERLDILEQQRIG
ncbi:hypothetical protein A6R68_22417 [Neotoma lepida]|uniref:RabBD domain-containing protein n=1 Tax=Neotoma lepida TaxID=56216 RepID=A0A1A6HZF4_NEOLE|nr:hypothetical protein A6R68_22417 [Neotoma lepida]